MVETDHAIPEANQIQQGSVAIVVVEEAHRIIGREAGVEAEAIAYRISNHSGEHRIQLRLEEEAMGIQRSR